MDHSVLGMLVAAITAMASVVTFLYRQIMAAQTEMKTRLDNCSAHHEEANKQILALSVEMAEIKGKQTGIKEFGDLVLATVKEGHKT